MAAAFESTAFENTAFEVGAAGPSVTLSANARMMLALLPPGRLWRLVATAILSKVIEASADELGRVDARVTDLLDEADPSTAVELLPDYERELDLESDGATAERQARIVARLIARQRYRPVDFRVALASLLGQDADDVVVLERGRVFAAATLNASILSAGGVPTSGGVWSAVLSSAGMYAGSPGNALKLDIVVGLLSGTPGGAGVEVRDGQRFDADNDTWIVAADTVGVAIDFDVAGTRTVAELEAALDADSAWCSVAAPGAIGDIQHGGGAADRYEGDFAGGKTAIAPGDDREIYRFFIYRNPVATGTYYLTAAQELVDKIKPEHAAGHVIESIGLLCDSATDLCDRDILGA